MTVNSNYLEDSFESIKSKRTSLRRLGSSALHLFINPFNLETYKVAGTLGVLVGISSNVSQAAEDPFKTLFKEITGGVNPRESHIVLETPRLADNGHSAALRIYVESPMSGEDYVKSIFILSDRNPRPFIARFDLSPLNDRAEISTRVRLNGSQNVHALALTSKGEWFTTSVPVEVTESACLDAT